MEIAAKRPNRWSADASIFMITQKWQKVARARCPKGAFPNERTADLVAHLLTVGKRIQ
jgi:hypothetical protein